MSSSTLARETDDRSFSDTSYSPCEYDGVAPDKPLVVGKLVYALIHGYLTLVCYAVFLVLFALVLFGVIPSAHANRTIAVMLVFWLSGNWTRRSGALLTVHGRLTYRQTPTTVFTKLPSTLRGKVYVGILLCELVVVPLVLYAVHFHQVHAVSFVALLLYPPYVHSTVAPFAVLLFAVSLVGFLAAGVLFLFILPADACDPYWCTSAEFHVALRAVCCLAVVLLVPTFTTLTSSFPCEGNVMRFAQTQQCMSISHRLFMLYSTIMLCLHTVVLEMGLGAVWSLGDGEASSYKEEPRISYTFLNWKLWLRSVALLLAIYNGSIVAALGVIIVLLVPISNVKSLSTVELVSHLWLSLCFCLCSVLRVSTSSAVPWIVFLAIHLLFSLCVCLCALVKVPFVGRAFNVFQSKEGDSVMVEPILDV